jgi:hypothetical protein
VRKAACAVVAIGLALGGCMSLRPQVTSFATDYNRAIADSRNQMVLLNIARSSVGEPTHYSALSQVEATLTYKTNVGGGIGGVNAGDDDGFGTLSVETASAPTFTVVPLNTEEFATGVLQPINANAIRLLLTQGWDSRMVSSLLISKIECETVAPGEPYRRYVSNAVPERPGGLFISPFAGVGIGFVERDEEAVANSGRQSYEVTLEGGRLAELLSSGVDERYQIRPLPAEAGANRYRMTRWPDAIVFSIPAGLIDCPDPALADKHADGQKIYANGARVNARAYLRSIEGVIQYLGELIAADTRLGYINGDEPGGDKHILFAVERGWSGPASVRIEHGGTSYAIPARDAGSYDRSARVIALINQLLALQTSSETLKRAPSTVRVR